MASLNITDAPTTKPTDNNNNANTTADPTNANTEHNNMQVSFPTDSNLLVMEITPMETTTTPGTGQLSWDSPHHPGLWQQPLLPSHQMWNLTTKMTSCFSHSPVMVPSPGHAWS